MKTIAKRSRLPSTDSSISPIPSRAYLPKLPNPPRTVFEYLAVRFPKIAPETWEARIRDGKVTLDDGRAVTCGTLYQTGLTVRYFREVQEEPLIPFEEKILSENEDILVADKPHFLPVIPSGRHVNECLLSRLQRRLGLLDLAPLHRIDADTAGLVLFSKRKATRSLYHDLFATGGVVKLYHAVCAPPRDPDRREWLIATRLERGDPWFRMRNADGPVNAVTRALLVKREGASAWFQLYPRTGKKHQIRVHMASIGCPIVNDLFYPDLRNDRPADYGRPMQLLAKRLSFQDPVTGRFMEFESQQRLNQTESGAEL